MMCFDSTVIAGELISVRGVGYVCDRLTCGREGCGSGRAKVTVMHALKMQCQV